MPMKASHFPYLRLSRSMMARRGEAVCALSSPTTCSQERCSLLRLTFVTLPERRSACVGQIRLYLSGQHDWQLGEDMVSSFPPKKDLGIVSHVVFCGARGGNVWPVLLGRFLRTQASILANGEPEIPRTWADVTCFKEIDGFSRERHKTAWFPVSLSPRATLQKRCKSFSVKEISCQDNSKTVVPTNWDIPTLL